MNRPNKASRPSSPAVSGPHKSTSASSTNKSQSTTVKQVGSATQKSSSTATNTPNGKPAAPAKAPPKGSYAEVMLRAQALQNKAPMNVGMIKHQSAPKERVSKVSKRRMMEAKKQEQNSSKGKDFDAASIPYRKGNNIRKPAEPEYKGTAKPSSKDPTPAYKGTAGIPSRRGTGDKNVTRPARNQKPRARDEYLGTDEEDEGDYGYDEDDYYSDASSDMEAGIMDVDNEEQQALRAAKREDEEELRLEMAAKKEKMDRKKKLAALAKSR